MTDQPVNRVASCCKHCGRPVKGRADKQYCNDMCRNAYNNSRSSEEHAQVRAIDLALKKNRRILKILQLGFPKMLNYVAISKFCSRVSMNKK